MHNARRNQRIRRAWLGFSSGWHGLAVQVHIEYNCFGFTEYTNGSDPGLEFQLNQAAWTYLRWMRSLWTRTADENRIAHSPSRPCGSSVEDTSNTLMAKERGLDKKRVTARSVPH